MISARFSFTATLAISAGLALLGHSAQADEATFTRDVMPILQAKCQECHRPGDIAPMSLLNYEEARPWAKSIKKNVAARVMPPWGADKGEYEFANDVSLTDKEIQTIAAWVDAGAPEGDPAHLPPPAQFPDTGWRSGEPDMVFQHAPYPLGGNVNDEYRCYVFESNLKEDTWLRGIEYKPGNRRVVHHIMAYAEPTHRARAKDAATPEPGFVCGMNGDAGTTKFEYLLGGWAPGTPPNMFSKGVGRVLPAGTDIVFQVHYHNTTGAVQEDASSMGIYFAHEPIKAVQRISLVGVFKLDLPAGDSNVVNRANWRAPFDMTLFSVMPHMHFLGKAMKVTAFFPDGRESVLVNVPRFDFNWQIVYGFKEPVPIPRGTRFEMISAHDNSAENPANPSKPPKRVLWGEATDEEMAHAWLGFIKTDENLNIIPKPPVVGMLDKPESAGSSGGE